jgi:hypothetical protein
MISESTRACPGAASSWGVGSLEPRRLARRAGVALLAAPPTYRCVSTPIPQSVLPLGRVYATP